MNTVIRFLHFAGLVVHYAQEIPRWCKGIIPSPSLIRQHGATDKRGLRYHSDGDCVIPGFGSGTRPVAVSDAILTTVFIQV